ncbi:metallophosphoesterase family protein [Sorangium sp. So ce1151]|uniref:metallophosphoesterase family protein n=1 Tax=Sorangium sp. So ce1151 TaxID=3133332 RepID=UPI003F61F5AD
MILKFVHCADVHLDSPLRGLSAYDGAPVESLRGATRRGFENLVNLCMEEEADFLVIAGDLYDGEWLDFNTGLYFAKQMARLGQRGISAYVVRGNHDAESKITQRLSPPDNVHVFGSRKAETVAIERLKVALHGQSFAKRDTLENLATSYPTPRKGWFNIGVLHTALDGREGHSGYAPCALDHLRARGYDYWALGHVHKREVLCQDPWVVFPGNVQGRSVRERGAKGCTIVSVDDGQVITEHRAVDVLRWACVIVDASAAVTPDDVLDRVRDAIRRERTEAEGRFLAARVRIEGRCDAHDAILRNPDLWKHQVRAAGVEAGQDDVWVEKVETATQPLRGIEEVRRRDDAIGELLRSVREVAEDPGAIGSLVEEMDTLLNKLPPEVREAMELHDLRNPEHARVLIEDAERLLLARINAWGAAQ